jgi:hypothetical protein
MSGEVDALPVTALLATEPQMPVVVFDNNAALRMAVVDRVSLPGLDGSWDATGVYVLLDRFDADGSFGAYVGKAPQGLRGRLREHASKRGRESWQRAVLVMRDTTHGWHSAHVGWLEGRLYALLEGGSAPRLSNGNRPQDETVPPHDRAALESAIEPVAALLRLLGYPPDAEDDPPSTGGASSRRRSYSVTVADLLAAGYLTVGETVASTKTTTPESGTVNGDGSITVDGAAHSTPSAAGSALRDGHQVNGWELWAVERDGSRLPLATVRSRYLAATQQRDGEPSQQDR